MQRIKICNHRIIIILLFLLLVHIVLYLVNFNKIYLINNKIHLCNKDNLKYGNIFVTGNLKGTLYYIGCNNKIDLTAKRSYVLSKYNNYINIDLGNFTYGNAQIDSLLIPLLLECFKYMKISCINFTKWDLLNISNVKYNLQNDLFVSANIETNCKMIPINKYKLVPLTLKSNNDEILINVGITGISDDQRLINKNNVNYNVLDIKSSLNNTIPNLYQADIKILLFNSSFFKLKEIVNDNKMKIDLIIAQSSEHETTNKFIYINGIPIIFIDEYGTKLANVKIYKRKYKYEYDLNIIDLIKNIPEDNKIRSIVDLYYNKIQQANCINK